MSEAREWFDGIPVTPEEDEAFAARPASCPRDTDGDGNCGRRYCPYCGRRRPPAPNRYVNIVPCANMPTGPPTRG